MHIPRHDDPTIIFRFDAFFVVLGFSPFPENSQFCSDFSVMSLVYVGACTPGVIYLQLFSVTALFFALLA